MAKPDPKLSDMPPHIKQSIVDDLDTGTKLSLRGIDKQFKEVVENSAINYESLTLSLNSNKIELVWRKTRKETAEEVFKPTKKGYVIKKGTKSIKCGEGDYRKVAVAKMLSVFEYSKVSVGELIFRINRSYTRENASKYKRQQFEVDRAVILKEIGRILPLKNFRLKIGKLDSFTLHKAELMSVLPHLEPGILKALRVAKDYSDGPHLTTTPDFDDQTIVDTDQWKQLKEVDIEAFQLDIPFEKYSHFKRVDLRLTTRSTGTMKTLLEKVLQTPTMKRCWLQCPAPDVFDMTGVQEYVDQFKKTGGSGCATYIKNPYEEGKEIKISIMLNEILNVQK